MEINLESYKNIFRAYDIRGVYGQEISGGIFFRIGQAFGDFLISQGIDAKQNHVYIGFDIRKTSPLLVHAFSAGVMSTGITVDFSGEPLQFGACMFTAWKSGAFATAFVTASHLPPDWNGVKFYYGSGVGFSEEDNMKIRDIFLQKEILPTRWQETGSYKVNNLKDEYVSFLANNFSLNRKLKVVIDCGNGAACLSAPGVLRAVNLEVIELFCDVDPLFPNRSSEPNENTLVQLAKMVPEEGADFGVAFDGDGDRAVIVDDLGRVILADITGLLLAKHLLKEDSICNRVIVNVECSIAVEQELESIAFVDRIQVGHTFLTAKAQRHKDTLLGIESSGHMVFPDIYLFDDAMIIPLKLALILSRQSEPLSVLVDRLPQLYKRKIAVPVSDQIKFQVINELLIDFQKEYSDINTIDGVGIRLSEDSWVLIRASNTSPKIRVICEAKNDDKADIILKTFQDRLNEKINELS